MTATIQPPADARQTGQITELHRLHYTVTDISERLGIPRPTVDAVVKTIARPLVLAQPATKTPPTPKPPRPDHRPTYVTALPATQLFVDHTYQRDLNEPRVQKMAVEFDPTLLGVLEVSDRGNGTFAIIEGQHRWAAAWVANPELHLVCQVHRDLTPTEEADLFYTMDVSRRTLSGWDRWKARRVAGDPVVLEIEAIISAKGLIVEPGPTDGHIGASGALERVHQMGGRSLLINTINVLHTAYLTSRDAYDAPLVQGVGLILHHYDLRTELDVNRLVGQLQTIVPRQIKARAAALREIHSGQLPKLTAAVIIERYNAAPGRKVQGFLDRCPTGR